MLVFSQVVVKNVFSYGVFMWGIYLDHGSSKIVVSNNVVYNTDWTALFHHYGANNTIINNVFARTSLFPRPQPIDSKPDGDVRIQQAENYASWTYTWNIAYDTFQGRCRRYCIIYQQCLFQSTWYTVTIRLESNDFCRVAENWPR